MIFSVYNEIMKKPLNQLYRITNIKNSKHYYGIVYSPGKTYIDRFKDHMSGKGSRWIFRDLESKKYQISDFITVLIKEFDNLEDLRQAEIDHIKKNNTLWPNGYNGNAGNMIIARPDAIQRGIEKRIQKIKTGELCLRGIGTGKAIFINDKGERVKISINHPKVISGEWKHQNYKGGDIKQQNEKDRITKERIQNNGFTDKQVKANNYNASRLINEVVGGEKWLLGREKYRSRMKAKEYTDKEIETYNNRTEIITNQWKTIDREKRLERTSKGLSNMNSKLKCSVCGTITNKGNIARWHNGNCKKR